MLYIVNIMTYAFSFMNRFYGKSGLLYMIVFSVSALLIDGKCVMLLYFVVCTLCLCFIHIITFRKCTNNPLTLSFLSKSFLSFSILKMKKKFYKEYIYKYIYIYILYRGEKCFCFLKMTKMTLTKMTHFPF